MAILTRFRRFFRDAYDGAHVLTRTAADYTPGMLLDTDWDWDFEIDGSPGFEASSGYAWEWLSGNAVDYPTVEIDAGLLEGPIVDELSFGGSLSLPQFGLSFSANLSRRYELEVRVGALIKKAFEKRSTAAKLLMDLYSLKKSNPGYWREVKDDFLVFESIHATQVEFRFTGQGQAEAKADFEAAGLNVGVGFNHKWVNQSTLVLNGKASTPMALVGRRVKPFMPR